METREKRAKGELLLSLKRRGNPTFQNEEKGPKEKSLSGWGRKTPCLQRKKDGKNLPSTRGEGNCKNCLIFLPGKKKERESTTG